MYKSDLMVGNVHGSLSLLRPKGGTTNCNPMQTEAVNGCKKTEIYQLQDTQATITAPLLKETGV